MILRDITVSARHGYPRAKEFNREANCISALFRDCIPEIKTEDVQKIIVEARQPETLTGSLFEKMLDVRLIAKPFDFDAHWGAPAHERKRRILEFLMSGLRDLCSKLDLPYASFEKAAREAEERNLIFEKSLRPKASPNRKLRAQLHFLYEMDRIDLWIRFLRGNDECSRIKIATTKPHEIFLVPLLGTLKWRDNNTVVLHSKDKQMRSFKVPSECMDAEGCRGNVEPMNVVATEPMRSTTN